MPLKETAGPNYIQRRRFFVDSDIRVNTETSERYDITVRPNINALNVESLELVNYNFSAELAPTFIGQQGNLNGNNYLDVRMVDHPAAANTLSFSVALPEVKYQTADAFGQAMVDILEAAMDEQNDVFFNTGTTSFSYADNQPFLQGTGGNGALIIYAERGGANTVQLYFDFATGANNANSAHAVFGYPKVDVGGPATLSGTFVTYPYPYYAINLDTFRYVDITVRELQSDLILHSRVYLTLDFNYRRIKKNIANARLLLNPPQRLDDLRITIRLAGGYKPNQDINEGYDLTFDVLQIVPHPEIPEYIKDKEEFVY